MKDFLKHLLVPRPFGTDIVLGIFVIAYSSLFYCVYSGWGLLEGLGRRIEACILIVGAA